MYPGRIRHTICFLAVRLSRELLPEMNGPIPSESRSRTLRSRIGKLNEHRSRTYFYSSALALRTAKSRLAMRLSGPRRLHRTLNRIETLSN